MATIITKNSQTPGAVPSAASLSTGELAVNTADGRLFTEHSDGSVREVQGIAAGTGISVSRSNGVATVANSGVTSVTATSPIATSAASGGITLSHANSGVTANTYGGASAIPIITVNAQGHITSVSTATPSASAPTTAQVLSATAGLTAGDVGSYGLFRQVSPYTDVVQGGTKAGSGLEWAGIYVVDTGGGILSAGNPAGTWRCLGRSPSNSFSIWLTTVWVRIS